MLGTGTLTLDATTDVTNTGGHITVDALGTLALNAASITEGNLEVLGTLTSAAATDALHNVTVDNDANIEVLGTGTLTLDLATSVDNTGGTITVDALGTLALNDASITDGNLEVLGTLTSAAATDALHNVTVDNDANIEVLGTGTLTLDQATSVDNTGGKIEADTGATLDLTNATIIGGLLTGSGTIALIGNGSESPPEGSSGHPVRIESGPTVRVNPGPPPNLKETIGRVESRAQILGAEPPPTTPNGTIPSPLKAFSLAKNGLLNLQRRGAVPGDPLVGDLDASALTGALTVTTGDATDNTISITTGSAATSITDSFSSDTVTVDATALANNTLLTLTGSAAFAVTGLKGDLDAQRADRRPDGDDRRCHRQHHIDHDWLGGDLDHRQLQYRYGDGERDGAGQQYGADADRHRRISR